MAADVYLKRPDETREQWIQRCFECSRSMWELALNIIYGDGTVLDHHVTESSRVLRGVDGFIQWCNNQGIRNPRALLRCIGHTEAGTNPYKYPILDKLGPCDGIGHKDGMLLLLFTPSGPEIQFYRAERREGSNTIHLVKETPKAIEAMTDEALLSALDERRMAEDWDDQPGEMKRKVGSLIKTLSKLVKSSDDQDEGLER